MKKVIIGLTGMVLIAVVVILFVNAKSGKDETKKATTEVASKCGACPSASTCTEMKGATATTETKAACCGSAKTETAKTEACASAKEGCGATCASKAAIPTK